MTRQRKSQGPARLAKFLAKFGANTDAQVETIRGLVADGWRFYSDGGAIKGRGGLIIAGENVMRGVGLTTMREFAEWAALHGVTLDMGGPPMFGPKRQRKSRK